MDDAKSRRWKPGLPGLIAGTVVLLYVLFTVFRDMGVVDTWTLGKSRDQILEENTRLRAENTRMGSEVKRLRTDPAYIEEIARRELGLIGQEENVIVLDRQADGPPPSRPKGIQGPP
jgi:cell division protein FtsB